MQSDQSNSRFFHATGNVHLTYIAGPYTWQLSAGEVDYTETHANDVVTAQTATARNNVQVSGPGVTIATPGVVDVDFLAQHLTSEGPDITLTFEGGDITTDRLDVAQTQTSAGVTDITVKTFQHTSATYTLDKRAPTSAATSATQASVFGSLAFDFSRITLDTERTTVLVRDGKPVRLDCPDPTTIASPTNTVHMPSCSITFDPPTVTGSNGVEIGIGNATTVHAASFVFTYPPDGGMSMDLTGDPSSQVTVTNQQGTFYADEITVSLSPSGAKRIQASGHTRLEMPMGELTGEQVDRKQ
jgi:hypothetical protein